MVLGNTGSGETDSTGLQRLAAAAVAIFLAILFAMFMSHPAEGWNGGDESPVVISITGTTPHLQIFPNGTVAYLGRNGVSSGPAALVRRPLGGPIALAPAFPSAFASNASTDYLELAQPDAAGNLLVFRRGTPRSLMILAPGASPSDVEPLAAPSITAIDLAPTGEAAAIVSSGSTASVAFRPAGPATSFDTPRTLDRAGNQRSYAVGITLDPDGGVFVVYRTEQARAVLQAYAPPGEDFGSPSAIPVPDSFLGAYSSSLENHFSQSTNGHGILTWGEETQGTGTTTKAWAAVREPGGLLGTPVAVTEVVAGRTVFPTAQGITDDGTAWVGMLDAQVSAGCNPNSDLDRGAVIARLAMGASEWTLDRDPADAWPNTSSVAGIATGGNRVAVAIHKSLDNGNRCASTNASTSLEVRMSDGGTLGNAVRVVGENITDSSNTNAVNAHGLVINAAGDAALLARKPVGTQSLQTILFHHNGDGSDPDPGDGDPLPPPGKIKLSGKTIKVTGNKAIVDTACQRMSTTDEVFCSVAAVLIAEANGLKVSKPRPLPVRAELAKKKAKTVKIGKLKVKIAAGKSKKLKIKLSSKARKRLKGSKKPLSATLQVTITKGDQKIVLKRKIKLKLK